MSGDDLAGAGAAALWMGEARLASYLAPCGGDLDLAMGLYRWNLRLAQAVLHDVALFEVALRNAYDRCISEYWGHGDWLTDEASPVRRPIARTNRRGRPHDQNRINRRTIDSLVSTGRPHDWVVSNLSLGFWAHLTDRSHERDLWIPCLHRTWPSGSARSDVAARVTAINRVRNRAAHHERLFDPADGGPSVVRVSDDVAAAFAFLVPQGFRERFPRLLPTAVRTFLAESPAPAGVRLA